MYNNVEGQSYGSRYGYLYKKIILISTILLSSCRYYDKDLNIDPYRYDEPEILKAKAWHAVEHKNIEELDALLRSMQDKEAYSKDGNFLHARNKYGNTPLHMAAMVNAPKMVAFLLDHGADPKAVNKEGGTPLQVVVPNIWKVINASFGSGVITYTENEIATAKKLV